MIEAPSDIEAQRVRNLEAAEDARRYARWNPLCIVLSAVLLAWACVDILTHPTIKTCLEMLLPMGSLLLVVATLRRGRSHIDEWPSHPSMLLALSGAVMLAGSLALPNVYHFHKAIFTVAGSLMLAAVVILLGMSAIGYLRLRRNVTPPTSAH